MKRPWGKYILGVFVVCCILLAIGTATHKTAAPQRFTVVDMPMPPPKPVVVQRKAGKPVAPQTFELDGKTYTCKDVVTQVAALGRDYWEGLAERRGVPQAERARARKCLSKG